jgi:methionyl-tRNA formyltransferase
MTRQPYRIIFMGTPEFAVPTLRALLAHGEEVVCVVTQPDRPKGRSSQLLPPPVKLVAEAAGIPVLQPTKIRTQEFADTLKSYSPDLIVVTAYGRILPASVLFLPPLGSINVHASLLPKFRGAAPIQWALIKGEPETGVTIMRMDEGLDTGDILLPGAIPIAADETTATLAVKLASLGGELLVKALDLLRAGKLPPIKQDDSQATLAPSLTKEQGLIDWQQPASQISCLIRGMDPWPGAFTTLAGKRCRLFMPQVVVGQISEPVGTIHRVDSDGLLIATGRDYLLVPELQVEGGKRMPVDVFRRGHAFTAGETLV